MNRLMKKVLLICFLLSFALAACEPLSCALQAVAGGSQACQEAIAK